jgi:putative serine protease PepD
MEAYVSDDATPTNPYEPTVNGTETEPQAAVMVEDSPTDPVGPPPWPVTAPGTRSAPPAPPQPPTDSPSRPGRWKQFLVGALVGALVGGATAAGVTAATDDNSGGGSTVVVRSAQSGARNTSTIAHADDVQSILAKVEPAVVAISARSNLGAGAGTGFVISADGVIVTNNHVVDGANQIEATFHDGSTKRAEVLGSSADNDLAVLKVEGSGLPTAKLGSSDALQVGDEVIAIGNALDLGDDLSVTRGIISAKDRSIPEAETGVTIYGALQTDAAINPGNSGGPLVNADGEVVGINTAIANPTEAQNVGFAIAIDTAKSVIDDLRLGREVRAAFLGVATQETDNGVRVVQVTEGSAAADAGVERGDVIIAIGNTAIETPEDLGAAVRRMDPGDEVQIRVERDGSQETLTAKLGTRPNNDNG